MALMREVERIADELRRAFYGPAWHGPSLREALAGISASAAAAHPIAGAHSIWELVSHLHAWIVEVGLTARGKTYESLRGEKDWPAVTGRWEDLMADLDRAERALEEAVLALPEEKLGFGEHSLYLILHGIAQHHAYHAGQIALLKK